MGHPALKYNQIRQESDPKPKLYLIKGGGDLLPAEEDIAPVLVRMYGGLLPGLWWLIHEAGRLIVGFFKFPEAESWDPKQSNDPDLLEIKMRTYWWW